MENYEDRAIEAVRDYLVDLLKQKQFCEARRVGDALRMLVESKRPQVVNEEMRAGASVAAERIRR